ncbi:MAG: hypothetical protein IJ190_09350 [Prevotella sp.]|nr:hypothetical protein [Prevotella sp.]
MKKYLIPILTLFMSATLSLCLASCGDDDNEDRAKSSPFTGTWRYSYAIDNYGNRTDFDFDAGTITFYEDGAWHTEQLDGGDGYMHFDLYFNGDGKGLWKIYVFENNKDRLDESYPIEYEFNNDKITIKYDSDYIEQMKKYADADEIAEIEEGEKFEAVFIYDSENETLCWQENGGSVYFTKK